MPRHKEKSRPDHQVQILWYLTPDYPCSISKWKLIYNKLKAAWYLKPLLIKKKNK